MADRLLPSFIDEAKVQLAQATRLLHGMERGLGMASTPAINDCFRAIHTLSGLAGHLALARIQALLQCVEQLLEELHDKRHHRQAPSIDALLRAVQRIGELVECLSVGSTPAADDHDIICALRTRVRPREHAARVPLRRGNDRIKRRFLRFGQQITTGPPRFLAMGKAGHA